MNDTAVPGRGDIVWIDELDATGHEQKKRRPALVLSPQRFNSATKLCIVCPITSKQKGFALEVVVPEGYPVSGVVLVHHIRSVDWKARNIEFICSIPALVAEVVDKFLPLIESEEL